MNHITLYYKNILNRYTLGQTQKKWKFHNETFSLSCMWKGLLYIIISCVLRVCTRSGESFAAEHHLVVNWKQRQSEPDREMLTHR